VSALSELLQPLIAVSARYELTAIDLHQALDQALVTFYVDEVLRREERSPTADRVAMYAGMSAAEIYKTYEELARLSAASEPTVQELAAVLHGWHSDSRFSGMYGVTRDLQYSKNGDEPTFESLVEEFAPCRDVEAVLSSLEEGGCVKQLPGNVIRVRTRSYTPPLGAKSRLQRMGKVCKTFNEVFRRNLLRADGAIDRGLLELVMTSDRKLSREGAERFSHEVSHRFTTTLSELDSFISSLDEKCFAENGIAPGVGVYFFEDSEDEGVLTQRRLDVRKVVQ